MTGVLRLPLTMRLGPRVNLSLFEGDLKFVLNKIGWSNRKKISICKLIFAFSSIIINTLLLRFMSSVIPLFDDIR